MGNVYEDYLMHFNKNHDPRNGRFAPSSDYTAYRQLKKRRAKTLSDAELERVNKRRKLEYEYKHGIKSPAQEAAKAELARFGVKLITSAAVAAAAAVGVKYLKKKYNISPESIGKGFVNLTGRFASTVAKETAGAVTDAIKSATPAVAEGVKTAAKNAGSAVKTAAKNAGSAATKAAASLGEAEIRGAKKAGSAVVSGLGALGEAELKAAKVGAEFLGRVFKK